MKTVEQLRQMAIEVYNYLEHLDYLVAYEIDENDYLAELIDNPNDYYITYDKKGELELTPKENMEQRIKEHSRDIEILHNEAVRKGMNFYNKHFK